MTYITFSLANRTFRALIGADPSIILGLLTTYGRKLQMPTKQSTL